MEIIPYEERYRQTFIDFNTAWIVDYFGRIEIEDMKTFDHIDEELKAGAMIFFAVEEDKALATCMVRPLYEKTWEICKMGSSKTCPHKGAGSAVFASCIEWADLHGADRLFILSNSRLEPAIHIYKKFGFQQIELEDYEYERGDIAFEKILQREEERK